MDGYPIVVGYDGTAGSRAALRWALREAGLRRLDVRLVRVVDPVPAGAASAAPQPAAGRVDRLRETQRLVQMAALNAMAAASAGVMVTGDAYRGPVTGTLCEQSELASLIVVGSRSIGRLAGLLAGSVSIGVAAHARCPVVVVRPDVPEMADGPIVVGVDDSPEARLAVGFAFEEAALRHVAVVAVHAWLPATLREATALRDATARQVLDGALSGFRSRYGTVAVRTKLVSDHAGHALERACEGAQLMVVGSRGRGAFRGLALGSVSQRVLHHAQCPVAVIRAYPTPASTPVGVTHAGAGR